MANVAATIKDVAREAGVSISTVSSVLNGNKPVSDELAQRVRAAVERLGFHPNHMARTLHAKRTKTLAYLTPDITNVAFLRTFRAVEARCHARGYSVFLLGTDGSVQTTREAIGRVIGLRMDGAFLTMSWAMAHPDVELNRLAQRDISVVGVSGAYELPDIDCFLHDEEGGGRQVGEYLRRLGHERVLCIGPSGSRAAENRWTGIRRAYGDADTTTGEHILPVMAVGYDAAAGYDAVQSALTARIQFTVAVAFNDAIATGALACFADNGIAIPDDVSFVSFGDGHRDFHRPQITSVTFDEERVAGLAANRLIDRVEGSVSDIPSKQYLPLSLTIRPSSRRRDIT